jgi:hypothetical protein
MKVLNLRISSVFCFISLNAHYMVLFKNPRDVSQIMALAHQMYSRRTQFFLEAFARATARPRDHVTASASDARVTRNGV